MAGILAPKARETHKVCGEAYTRAQGYRVMKKGLWATMPHWGMLSPSLSASLPGECAHPLAIMKKGGKHSQHIVYLFSKYLLSVYYIHSTMKITSAHVEFTFRRKT